MVSLTTSRKEIWFLRRSWTTVQGRFPSNETVLLMHCINSNVSFWQDILRCLEAVKHIKCLIEAAQCLDLQIHVYENNADVFNVNNYDSALSATLSKNILYENVTGCLLPMFPDSDDGFEQRVMSFLWLTLLYKHPKAVVFPLRHITLQFPWNTVFW